MVGPKPWTPVSQLMSPAATLRQLAEVKLSGFGHKLLGSRASPGLAPRPILCSQRPLLSFGHGQAGTAQQEGLVLTSLCCHSDEEAQSQLTRAPTGLQLEALSRNGNCSLKAAVVSLRPGDELRWWGKLNAKLDGWRGGSGDGTWLGGCGDNRKEGGCPVSPCSCLSRVRKRLAGARKSGKASLEFLLSVS